MAAKGNGFLSGVMRMFQNYTVLMFTPLCEHTKPYGIAQLQRESIEGKGIIPRFS